MSPRYKYNQYYSVVCTGTPHVPPVSGFTHVMWNEVHEGVH
jgi:hypothetical protein